MSVFGEIPVAAFKQLFPATDHLFVHESQDQNPTPEDIAELRRAIAELREAVRARDEFIAIAAHELRNPMTPMLGWIERLLIAARRPETGCPALIVAGLERLGDVVERYLQRVDTLLDVARITSGRRPLEPVSVDLSELVSRATREVAPLAARAGCALRVAVQDDVVGIWDRLALEQIIDNLLSNAFKYGAGKPIEVALAAAEGSARLTVRDYGIGISAEDQTRIFGRFERAVTQRTHGGYGIGLWVAHQLVTAMSGGIEVDSVPNQGSTFSLVLPLTPQDG